MDDIQVNNPSQNRAKKEKRDYEQTEYEKDCQWDAEYYLRCEAEVKAKLGSRTNELLQALQKHRARATEFEVAMEFSRNLPFCESEIEKLFLVGLMGQLGDGSSLCCPDPELWRNDPSGFLTNSNENNGKFGVLDYLFKQLNSLGPTPIAVLQQVPISSYRVDFLLFATSMNRHGQDAWLKLPLIVECDGHDFHERTKEQVRRDRKRERALLSLGYHVMRFTGSELWRDPHGCAMEALRFIYDHQPRHHAGF